MSAFIMAKNKVIKKVLFFLLTSFLLISCNDKKFDSNTLTGKVTQLSYTVRLSYGFDIDPKYSASLEIKIDTITNRSKEIKYVKSEDRRGFLEKLLTE